MLDTIDLGQLAYIAESTLLLSFLFGVVAHEAGHAATAWLLGLDMRRVSLGAGPALLRFRLAASAILFGCMGENRAELDRWSAEACALAPCAATTLTRAGVLAALNRGAEALASLRTLAAGRRSTAWRGIRHLTPCWRTARSRRRGSCPGPDGAAKGPVDPAPDTAITPA